MTPNRRVQTRVEGDWSLKASCSQARQIFARKPAPGGAFSGRGSIAGAFNLWKRFPEPRRAQMKSALERIAKQASLSPDVAEIVSRTLED